MAFYSNPRKPRDQSFKYTHSPTPTTLSNLSHQNHIPNYSSLGSDGHLSSTAWNPLDCTSCLGEPGVAGSCQSPAGAEEHQQISGCIDPACTETICDECFDHDDCCAGCGADCESDCGISFDCDEFHIGGGDTYACETSYSELFGDQTAQTFGFGSPLPELETDTSILESAEIKKVPDVATLSTLPDYSVDPECSDSILQPNLFAQMPWALHRHNASPQATVSSRSSCGPTYNGPPSHESTPTNISPFTCQLSSPLKPSKFAHCSLDPTDTTVNAHYDHVNLLGEQTDLAKPFHPSLRCEWADSNGEPCGKTLGRGEDMHEHLKTAHGVKGEVFCRWVGCCVGALTASPHRFASSVERHTWGHSGYRPYKCPSCNEGFAAASVRDEHIANIHMRKKTFACDMCSHQCTSATNLKRHKDDKHSLERFQCEFCNQHGKRRLFPRGPNLARHLRTCKYVLAQYPEAAAAGKTKADWLPPGYRRGHHGMDRAKITPPNYLSAQQNV